MPMHKNLAYTVHSNLAYVPATIGRQKTYGSHPEVFLELAITGPVCFEAQEMQTKNLPFGERM